MTDEELRKIDAPVKGKKEEASPRQKKINTALFSLFCSIILIVFSSVMIIAIWFVWMLFFITLLHFQASFIHTIGQIVAVFGGLFVGFKLYTIFVRAIIKWFHLEKRIKQDVLDRYKKTPKAPKPSADNN